MRRVPVALVLFALIGCQPSTDLRYPPGELVEVTCVGVPDDVCDGVEAQRLWWNNGIAREDIKSATVTCVGPCTERKGSAEVIATLFDGSRRLATTVSWDHQ